MIQKSMGKITYCRYSECECAMSLGFIRKFHSTNNSLKVVRECSHDDFVAKQTLGERGGHEVGKGDQAQIRTVFLSPSGFE